MQRETIGRVFFLTLLGFTLYLLYLVLKPLLPGIAWAIVLAVAFYPVYQKMVRWLRGRAWAASIALSGLIAAFVVVPCMLALIRLGQALVSGYDWLKTMLYDEATGTVRVRDLPYVSQALDWIGQFVDFNRLDLPAIALSVTRALGNFIASNTTGFLGNAASAALTAVIVLVTMAVLFHDGRRVMDLVREFVPLSEKDREDAIQMLRDMTRSVFFGVLVTAFVQGILGGIGTWAVGLPSPVTFGSATFFAALLPGGTVFVWGPASLWLLLTAHPWKALILAVWGGAVVSTVDNLLRPLFIGRGVRLHVLLVFFGILGGMLAFGLVGLFIGPLVIAFFLFLLEVFRKDLLRGAGSQTPSSES
jgi:predicted PurR-regulated permease PerM